MKISRNIKISNTNSNGSNESAVRIYKDGIKVAEVFINKRNPLNYIQSRYASKYLISIADQLRDAMYREIITIEDARAVAAEGNLNFTF